MEFEPIWWATVHSRRKPNRRLSNTPAITIPEALAIRPVTFDEGMTTLALGKGEALPAIPTAGHPRAQQDSFQGGAPRTAVCRAAAHRAAAQSMVRGICGGS